MGAGTGFDQNGGGGSSSTEWTTQPFALANYTADGGTLTGVADEYVSRYIIDGKTMHWQFYSQAAIASAPSRLKLKIPDSKTAKSLAVFINATVEAEPVLVNVLLSAAANTLELLTSTGVDFANNISTNISFCVTFEIE